MSKMFLVVLVAVGVLGSTIGCVGPISYLSMESSKKDVALRKAVASKDQNAIRAVRLGEEGVGVGIDVSNLEALKENPWRQVFSALGDGLLYWGAYEGAMAITGDGNNNDSSTTSAGRDQNQVVIKGDQNQVNIGNTTTLAPEPTAAP